jgi:diketogulonate reductase-like aldo/keto reductase
MEQRPLGTTTLYVPAVGQGTWNINSGMGRGHYRDEEAVEALRLGFDLGMTFIDTAEMYGAGHSEEIVAQAVHGWKDSVFIASKVSPSHFQYDSVLQSAKKSLQRLGVKQMDLYQLHWPNPRVPISETMRAMEKLVRDELIRHIGVSNFSVEQMEEAQEAMSREKIVSNQVEYSLLDRRVEGEIIPYCRQEKITVIAYSPLAQGGILRGRGEPFKTLVEVARALGKTRSQVALNWLLHDPSVVVIPKATGKEHVRENAEVSDWKLSQSQHDQLGKAFA